MVHGFTGSRVHGFIIFIFKILISGIFALIILDVLLHLYCNYPLTVIIDGTAKYEPSVFYSQGFEGFGWGRTNNDGYINTFDFHDGDLIKILVMGSSHMEAAQVGINYSAASVLNSLYGGSVYNTGISGHNLLVCARNIHAFVRKYKPKEYIVVEAADLKFPDEEFSSAIKNIDIQERTDLIWKIHNILNKSFLAKNSFLRLMHRQINHYIDTMRAKKSNAKASAAQAAGKLNNPELLSRLLISMRDATNYSGAKLIIAYHPSASIQQDGSMTLNEDEAVTAQFKEICEANKIYFVNTGERFLKEYNENFTLPYGFWNTSTGKGHMNIHGHRMFAEEIFKLINNINNNQE